MKKHGPWLIPIFAWMALIVALVTQIHWLMIVVCIPALIGAVLTAVHHAEVIAHRVGEPFGTLILALAVTGIEVSLMISMMMTGGAETTALPRDTLFATIMIILNGVVGICLLVGGIRHHEQSFRIEGTGSALASLIALSVLTLVLPVFTSSTPGPTYSPAQLTFAAVASLAMWFIFVFGQTIRHRDYFIVAGAHETDHAPPPSITATWLSLALLLVALVAVVGLAKTLSPLIASGMASAGAPKSALGIAIAMVVLLPEAWAAIRAARANRLQTSMNLALGSALASIGLTIPAVALAATILQLPLALGLGAKEMVLLMTSFLVAAVTLGSGRTNLMPGAIHLILFAAFLFLALVP